MISGLEDLLKDSPELPTTENDLVTSEPAEAHESLSSLTSAGETKVDPKG
jgi:hypothetical protein